MRINKNTTGYITIILLLGSVSIFSLNLYFNEKSAHDKLDIKRFPYEIGDWQGRDLPITEREYQVLETRNLISREYTNSKTEHIYLFIIYSETNRSVFHPPEVCMFGGGVKLTNKETEKINREPYSFLANRLYAQKGDHRELLLYSYKAGNLYTENFYLQQIYLASNQIFGRRVPGATIRVSMPMDKDEEAALDALKTFLAESAKIINDLSKA